MPQIGEIKTEIQTSGNKIIRTHRCIWVACKHCDRERWVRLVKNEPRSQFCLACGTKAERNGMWKGGRYCNNGYVFIRIERDNFFSPMESKSGYVLEHRLIMAKHLNRCLLPWEVVHHKNGIKGDNRFENLELLPDKRFHLIDTATKSYIRKLEREIESLRKKESK